MSYVSEPNGRGTISLVFSCLFTLLLCVWSALHLNVPYQRVSRLAVLWTNIKWIAIGVYAPELVVFTAWRQWSSARILAKVISDCQARGLHIFHQPVSGWDLDLRPSIEKSLKQYNEWTMTHHFFASTGGFAFDLGSEISDEDSEHEPFLPPDCPRRLHLTARGVALLAQCGHLPNVAEREIKDKSKANNLAKALVIIQASWMLIQVIGRLVVHLPVTLLEVNTVAHVLCAFLMYMMWWYKPLLAEEPILLRGPWIQPLCAYMFMCSSQSGAVDNEEVQEQTIVKKVFVSLSVFSKSPEINRVRLRQTYSSVSEEDLHKVQVGNGSEHFQFEKNLSMALSSKGSLEKLRQKQLATKAESTAFFERRPRIRMREDTVDSTDTRTIRRWKLAAEAISTYSQLMDSSLLQYSHNIPEPCHAQVEQLTSCIHPRPVEYVTQRVPNWPYDDLLRDVGGLTVGIVLWMCSFVYGCIHAAAWNEHFPTIAEKWLWRGSCIYISFCGGFWIAINSLASVFPRLNLFWESWMNGYKNWIYSVFLGGCVFICGSSFCASRVYLVVEAFVSIRSLPPQAYETPDWSQIFPHL